ncbi:MAG TPA: FAD-dependent oxidoreductase [Verrucomicrobiae bacterium]|nr:FAD-dependent oxidoreductase [Verrucomicrobiae bacterium]
MRTESVHTLILGAGPAGLAAGYTLAKAGHPPVIIDREKGPGGLMRSVHHGDFVVDVGRKELYNRLARVDEFWAGVIGADYRPYPHRGGYLYAGHILEMSRSYQGFRRGMPWSMFLGCAFGFLGNRLNVFTGKPRNVEEYFYRTRGRLLTRVVSQGFQEKLTGKRWADLSLPENYSNGDEAGLIATLRAAAKRAFSTREVNTFEGVWRHPARGTGQICDALAQGITAAGGSFGFGAKILEIKPGEGRIESVTAEIGSETVCYQPRFLISSIPLEIMITLLGCKVPAAYTAAQGTPAQRKTVVLVYLFLDAPPEFPHAWLQVTDPKSRIGRITNYSGFNSDMVPPGKGCLCCEYYAFGEDPLLALDPKELTRQTIDFCVQSGLVRRESFMEECVLKFPGADASQNRHNWITSMRLGLFNEVKAFANLYHVARTDLDIATLAGLDSADAVLSGDRTTFDRHFDPTEIGIRSERKAFEFKIPASAA